MVEVIGIQAVEVVKAHCRQEARAIKALLRVQHKRHTRLLVHIRWVNATLCSALAQVLPPPFPSKYSDFKQSFDLLKTQMEIALPGIEEPFLWKDTIVPPPEENAADWLDFLEDLEDMQKDLKRSIDYRERGLFLEVIKLLDTIERLRGFELPLAENELDLVVRDHLQQLLKGTIEIDQYLSQVLHRRKIRPIPLEAGDYPPIEETKIIFREDGGSGEEIIISRIVERGYFWKESILRKAAVVVTTKS